MTHGEAIAIGMICEAYLSHKNSTLTAEELEEIRQYISKVYPAYKIKEKSFAQLSVLMQSDKKNEHGNVLFSLLQSIGKCTYNCRVSESDIVESLEYYNLTYAK